MNQCAPKVTGAHSGGAPSNSAVEARRSRGTGGESQRPTGDTRSAGSNMIEQRKRTNSGDFAAGAEDTHRHGRPGRLCDVGVLVV